MRTHVQRAGSGVADVWSTVAAFTSAVDASLDRWLTQTYGVGLTDYRALAQVSATSDKELRIAELAQRVGLTSTSTTRLVSRLETKGLLRRDVCQDDGRGVYAVIVPAGEEMVREVRGPYETHLRGLLENPVAHLAPLDARALSAALGEVADLVEP